MRARNFNIDSLAVSRTDQPDVSRMTITLHGDDVAVEQAAKQLYRLIDVLKVQDVTAEPTIDHELALVKIRATDVDAGRGPQARRAVEGAGRRRRRRVGHRRGDRAGGRGRRVRRARPHLRDQGAGPNRGRRHVRAAPSRSRRRSSDDGADVLRQRRRSVGARRADGRDHRLRVAGPRPRPEPPRVGRRRRRRARAGLEEPGARRGGRAAGRRRRRRRPRGRRDHDPRPRHGARRRSTTPRSRRTSGPASC